MRCAIRFGVVLAAGLIAGTPSTYAQPVAITPPMGWNSWDSYGLTIDESDYKANAAALAALKSYGWTYAVIDEGWYMDNPLGDKLANRDYQLNGNGLLVPSLKRFPSTSGNVGFKPLADFVHAEGLKFGIHIVRGIPRQAVERNTPIEGSVYDAAEAADTADSCPWDDGNYGVRDNAAGQAYYDAMMRLYATWGVDFLKVDCIADHPYKASEIRQIALAIKKSGRPIVLSLSPGPTQLKHAKEISRYAQMWRISDDIWDGWNFDRDGREAAFPKGIVTAFDNLANWSAFTKPDHWPDADMLPFGALTPQPGWGEPRLSRLTNEEERTQFTLWAIARSPLILGANLTKLDDSTRRLITNKDVIAINQTAWDSIPVAGLPAGFEPARVWHALAGPRDKPVQYLAFFNLAEQPVTLNASWEELGLKGSHAARELWSGVALPVSNKISVTLPSHGSAVYRVE
jgi:hypothetical protein